MRGPCDADGYLCRHGVEHEQTSRRGEEPGTVSTLPTRCGQAWSAFQYGVQEIAQASAILLLKAAQLVGDEILLKGCHNGLE